MVKVNSYRPRWFAPNRSVSRARPTRSLLSLQVIVVVSIKTTTAAQLMGNKPATQKKHARSLPCRTSNTALTDHLALFMACKARAPLVASLARRNSLALAAVVEFLKKQHLNAYRIVLKSQLNNRCTCKVPFEIWIWVRLAWGTAWILSISLQVSLLHTLARIWMEAQMIPAVLYATTWVKKIMSWSSW